MNTTIETMKRRHAVRSYLPDKVEEEKIAALRKAVDECNTHAGLNFQLVVDEPEAFSSIMARYGKFSGVANYIALVARKGRDEQVGYYGEKVVLEAQALGLNTCWVAMTFSKRKARVDVGSDEKFYIAIPFGYGATQGTEHKSKPFDELASAEGDVPQWFRDGMEAVMLAPTAMNQQMFRFILRDGEVTTERKSGPCSEIDLGIAKYHFEVGSGKEGYFKL